MSISVRAPLVCLVALLAAFADPAHAAQRGEPLANFENMPVTTRGAKPSLSQVREAIIASGGQLSTVGGDYWQMQEIEPGRIFATLRWRTHIAEVTITYTPERYSVVYRGSSNLGYESDGPNIHPTYNKVVRALVTRIAATLGTTDGDPNLVIPPRGLRSAPVAAAPASLEQQGGADAIAVFISADPVLRQVRTWPILVAEWRNHMPAAVDAVDATLLDVQDGEPQAMGKPGTLVAVQVNRFRYVSPARPYTRAPAFQGRPTNAALDVQVRFFDLMTGKPIGAERAYAVTGSTGASSTNLQVRDLAQQIMLEWRRELATGNARAAASLQSAAADPAEVAFWESVRETKIPGELQAYLDQYPKGAFASLARTRLAELRAAGR